MIEINLLPPEYRPVEHTPLPRRLTIFVGVLLSCIGAAVCAWLAFVRIPNARTARDGAQQEAQKKKEEANEVLSKEAKIKSFDTRKNVLRELYSERVCWAKVLDRLAEARGKVDAKMDAGEGSVVLTSLELKRGAAAGPVGPGKRREVSQLVIKGCVPSFDADPSADKLRNQYLQFVAALGEDKEFADLFDGPPKLTGDRVIPSLASAGAPGARDAGQKMPMPKSGLEFEVIYTFKPPAPPAGTPGAPGTPGTPVVARP
jgi:Tfp pilus assembly protein PilN